MNVSVTEQVTRIATVAPEGRFDAFSSPGMREQFDQLLNQGVTHFIIDLSDTLFMDSAGMAVLVSLLKQARQRKGQVKLVWPKQEPVRRILNLTRFDRVFEMANSVEAAVKDI